MDPPVSRRLKKAYTNYSMWYNSTVYKIFEMCLNAGSVQMLPRANIQNLWQWTAFRSVHLLSKWRQVFSNACERKNTKLTWTLLESYKWKSDVRGEPFLEYIFVINSASFLQHYQGVICLQDKLSWSPYSSAAKHKFSQASSSEEKGSNRPTFINVHQIENNIADSAILISF